MQWPSVPISLMEGIPSNPWLVSRFWSSTPCAAPALFVKPPQNPCLCHLCKKTFQAGAHQYKGPTLRLQYLVDLDQSLSMPLRFFQLCRSHFFDNREARLRKDTC